MRRPTVSGAVLEAPEVAHIPLGLVGAARLGLAVEVAACDLHLSTY
jgi:hypothetical protein